jgi:hypothetical protein
MPDDVQTVLMLASCLGFVVDVNALEQIVLVVGLLALDKAPSREEARDSAEASQAEKSQKSAAGSEINVKMTEESKLYLAAYEQAVEEGLIEKMGYGKFKF